VSSTSTAWSRRRFALSLSCWLAHALVQSGIELRHELLKLLVTAAFGLRTKAEFSVRPVFPNPQMSRISTEGTAAIGAQC
jgi:hypothetical protein